ncbi:Hypothetical predicted protein [Podarcis lilfordi]|uniref:Uncharacterized protein n=1 Tax=Podarcis lilfordi TaxID=74358 RepID=A0AA35P7Y8_9SAUR|nr:Hypothetical predicted protein [Podarcis lilfordi]
MGKTSFTKMLPSESSATQTCFKSLNFTVEGLLALLFLHCLQQPLLNSSRLQTAKFKNKGGITYGDLLHKPHSNEWRLHHEPLII